MSRSIYRILKLEDGSYYKVQKFMPDHRKWFGLRFVPAGWKDIKWDGRNMWNSMEDAEHLIERLKHYEVLAEDKWTVAKSDL